ncbi:hypothetical protein AsAng_0013520 [Aureispira anguillae]|uniref:Lipoprotein n=1 Tax=Aureispira anguillae TaxID=2864201 RepID=A0A915YCN2_9BACT|nr:hypothetical protein AsAng_0013520 [Aureispira anguillae]
MRKSSASRDRKVFTEASFLYFIIGILFFIFLISCNKQSQTIQKQHFKQIEQNL